MKIIQSYAEFNEGTPRLFHEKSTEKMCLNFYSFLLSYLTLNKYYGHVEMYCNKAAQTHLIKYIPYDKVNIVENNNSIRFWSYYKVDIMKLMTEDFIHVDSDVFIFDDIFSKFIQSNDYDILIQNIIPKETNLTSDYVNQNREFLIKNDLFPNNYNGECYSCGTVGMRVKVKDGYVKVCEVIKNEFIRKDVHDFGYIGMASEEFAMCLYAINNGLKECQILPYADILKHGERNAGNYNKYTHMLLNTKFETRYVKLIRNKILKCFPERIGLVEKYEKAVMKNKELLKEIC